MIANIQNAIMALLKAERTRHIGRAGSKTEILRESFESDALQNVSDMRTLANNTMIVEAERLQYTYSESESDENRLVFINKAFLSLVDDFKKLLKGKTVSIEKFEDYLINQDFSSDDIDYIEGVLSKTPGFSLKNNTITFRGEDYVDPVPESQNPVNQDDLLKKYFG